MPKLNALQKIESHEKLCRIMQKLTHDKIHSIEERVKRLEKILLISTGSLISAMGYVIFTLLKNIKSSKSSIISLKYFLFFIIS